jgi:cytochrome c oxidase subunit 4
MSDHGHDFQGRLEEGVVHAFEDHPHHTDVHGSLGQYLMVFAALCVLTAMSFFTYSSYWPFQDQKQITWAFMMAISCTKAMLVISFFMHLLWEANWKWVLTIPASMMSVFLLLMLIPDVGMRQDNGFARYSRDRLLWAANPPAVQASERALLEVEEADTAHPQEHTSGGGP